MYPDEAKTKRVVTAFIRSEDDKTPEMEGFLWSMFGCESKIKKHEFIVSMTGKQKWFFKASDIRAHMKPFNNELWLNEWESENL